MKTFTEYLSEATPKHGYIFIGSGEFLKQPNENITFDSFKFDSNPTWDEIAKLNIGTIQVTLMKDDTDKNYDMVIKPKRGQTISMNNSNMKFINTTLRKLQSK